MHPLAKMGSVLSNATSEANQDSVSDANATEASKEVKYSRSGRAIISTPTLGYEKKERKKRTLRTPEELEAWRDSRRRVKGEEELSLEADIRENLDDLTDRSLIPHLKHLEPFIGDKTRQRLAARAAADRNLAAVSLDEFDEIKFQPSILSQVDMRAYQLHGLSWLVSRYERGLSCILADEMGLGKTLQLISFFAYLKESKGLPGPHLVVVPLSVLFNWVQECKKFCPALKIIRFHSNNTKEAGEMKKQIREVSQYEVCIRRSVVHTAR